MQGLVCFIIFALLLAGAFLILGLNPFQRKSAISLSKFNAADKRKKVDEKYAQLKLSEKALLCIRNTVTMSGFKEIPTLKDLYEELLSKEETKPLALMIEKFAVGSLSGFGGKTNVDLNNKYIVLDISEMTDHLKPLGMFMALDFVWDKSKESRIQKKVIFLDELWTLIGASSNRLAADYVLEIFKVIRGYGGAAFAATQDIGDFFSLDDGKYGKGVINNSRIKFILQLEEDEAFAVQKYMALSDEETMQIIRSQRGEALLCANRNKVCIDIKASPLMYHLLTTKRSDLEKRKKNGNI